MFSLLKKRFKNATKVILGRDINRREITVFPDDVFITSYPKSGSTWMRFLMANLLWCDDKTDFLTIYQRVPPIHRFSDRHLLHLPRPRYLNSHEYFDPKYPKVIYIVRDVRSVFISYYYHLIRRGTIQPDVSHYDFAQRFLAGELDRLGSWPDHILSWIRLRANMPNRFLLLRYEDLCSEPICEMHKIMAFLRLDRSEKQIKTAIENSSLDRMKTLEERAGRKWIEGRLAKNTNIPFVRAGDTTEWKRALDKRTIDTICECCGEIMLELGYEL